jgi:hypothetical protein
MRIKQNLHNFQVKITYKVDNRLDWNIICIYKGKNAEEIPRQQDLMDQVHICSAAQNIERSMIK